MHPNGGRWYRVEYLSRACSEGSCAIQPNNPSSVHFPAVPCGSFAPLDRRAQPILLGYLAQRRSPKVQGLWSVHRRCMSRKGPRIRFELKMAVSRELATCSALAATPLGRRSGRRPDLIGASQHLGIERRAIIRAALQFHCETARYYHRLLVTT
jgi:hypothetical protein